MTGNPVSPMKNVEDNLLVGADDDATRLRELLVARDQPSCFPVSLLKLTVMSIVTFGIYELYWFYKNWNLIKQREKIKIAPFWRAFFAYFFCYQCFSDIRAQAASLDLQQSLPAGPLAVGWIITTLLGNLLGKLPDPYWVVSLVSMFSFVFFLPVQALANRINARIAPDHDPNRGFTGWNRAGVAVGAIMLMLAILGTIDTLQPGFIDTLLSGFDTLLSEFIDSLLPEPD
jgi:hypothetical protein